MNSRCPRTSRRLRQGTAVYPEARRAAVPHATDLSRGFSRAETWSNIAVVVGRGFNRDTHILETRGALAPELRFACTPSNCSSHGAKKKHPVTTRVLELSQFLPGSEKEIVN